MKCCLASSFPPVQTCSRPPLAFRLFSIPETFPITGVRVYKGRVWPETDGQIVRGGSEPAEDGVCIWSGPLLREAGFNEDRSAGPFQATAPFSSS